MVVEVGDYFLTNKSTLFHVIEILDENYAICQIREYNDHRTGYGNWKQSIANIISCCNSGAMRKLSPAEIVLYGPVFEPDP